MASRKQHTHPAACELQRPAAWNTGKQRQVFNLIHRGHQKLGLGIIQEPYCWRNFATLMVLILGRISILQVVNMNLQNAKRVELCMNETG